jgi:hypothetical protein
MSGNTSEDGVHLGTIDGDASLKSQEDRLNFGQNAFTAEVTSYTKAEGGKPPNPFVHTNNVTFTEVDIGASVRPIHLKIVDGSGDPELEDSQELAFDDDVFVAGVVKRVVGFHQE